jgi:hypothetical protein
VVGAVWRKEDDLKGLKSELNNLERQIQLSLKPIEKMEGNPSENLAENQVSHEVSNTTQLSSIGERSGVRCSFT